ncbi:MAG: hypothetical protein M0Q44_10895 [Methylobacter sp.]|jgi:subfamily B ATP-binding cassette protein HlyB/CyaB|nr:hypothetical protein [Methylobacter sp.]
MRDALHRMVDGKKKLLSFTFVWALQCACQMHRVHFDAAMALRQLSSPYWTSNDRNIGTYPAGS